MVPWEVNRYSAALFESGWAFCRFRLARACERLALVVDGSGSGYLKTVCDYVLLMSQVTSKPASRGRINRPL
jgi:hypothetical protein